MRICWDNLEKYKVKYNKDKGFFRYWSGAQWKTFFYHDSCGSCGYPYLSGKDQRFCCKSCSNRETMLKNPERLRHWNEKGKETKLEKYGDKHFTNIKKGKITKRNKSKEEKEKTTLKFKETCLEKYGVENPNKLREVREKIEQTNLDRYGSTCVLSNEEIKEKSIKTIREKYNCNDDITNAFQIMELKEKGKETKLRKYGDENYRNKEKFEQTCLKRYGVKHISQSSEIHEKIKTGLKNSWHDYFLPSGKKIKLQGYEPQALDILLEKYKEEEILYKKSDVPEVWYKWEDKTWHRYYSDFYIPKENLVIEVKSSFTYKWNKNINILKKKATEFLGYNFKFMIL